MNEIGLLEKVLPTLTQHPGVAVGPGDDCAAIDAGGDKLLLAAVDQVVASVHYDQRDTAPQEVAAKLLKRNLSDIAAMGGVAEWALLSLASARDDEWLAAFYEGLSAAADKYNISVCGGDVTCLPRGACDTVGSLSIMGRVERENILLRSGANDGDIIFVTGELGDSYNSRHHLSFEPRLAEGAFLAAGGFATAAIDISDGLLLDAVRMSKASGAGMRFDPAVLPRRGEATLAQALGDGEDYELLFTVPAVKVAELLRKWPFETRLTRIGEVDGNIHAGDIYDFLNNKLTEIYDKGYEHTSN